MGPCYYPYSDNPFAPLMSYLAIVDQQHQLYAIPTQHILWEVYTNSIPYIGGGISAMPSMHVAMPFAAYAIIIMIGSVHLGWHYALDGYLAILGVWCIWHIVGWIVRRDTRLEEPNFYQCPNTGSNASTLPISPQMTPTPSIAGGSCQRAGWASRISRIPTYCSAR
jgi:hypothetical protein